jgi:regulator of sigma E protease
VTNILLGIIAVGFLIVVHEGGHYVVARWCQMRIERFSIGFGPGILKKTSKKTGTTFQIAPIPFGGFVEIRGMNIAEDVDPDDHHAYPNRPAWQRFVTIFAGPATNYLSAIALAMIMFTCRGIDDTHHAVVETVLKDYDAHGKLASGDRIRAVNHTPYVIGADLPTLPERINAAKGAPVTLTVERDGVERDVSITPRRDNLGTEPARKQLAALAAAHAPLTPLTEQLSRRMADETWRIGVVQRPDVVQLGVVTAAREALYYPVAQTKVIATNLYGIVFGNEKADPGGPIRMVEEFSGAFSRGMWDGIRLVMLLSVYLGLFNLLPIPALDGGRLVFLGYELVTRRRANPKIESMVHMAGIMALGVLMIFVFIVDVRRLF